MAKITFVGAGSAVFTRNLLADIMTYPALNGSEICLMDIDASKLALVEPLAKKMIEQEGVLMKVYATTDRRMALMNADYVIITIAVGGLDAHMMDIQIPEKYGVGQCVGDTLGPGGVFRGLRHMNVVSEICRELEEVSPNAFILQYTNPMVMICRAIEAESSIQHVGLCHSVQGTSEMLASFIGAPYEELNYWVAGINHMAWFLRLEWNGKDAYPLLREKMADPVIYGKEPTRFELMKHFGYFVTESSGHASEYFPYFRKRPDLLENLISRFTDEQHSGWFGCGRTGGCVHPEKMENYLKWFEEQLIPDKRIDISRSHEYGARIINAMETNAPIRINGNVANHGAVSNLPYDACVEVTCLIDENGIHPCNVGALPEQLAALNRTNLNVQELAVQGFLHRDESLVRQAIKLDPLTAAVCSLDEIDAMVTEMLEAEKVWLPQLK